jgi:tellurite resistance protein
MKLFQRLNEKQFSAMIDKLVGMIKRSGATELVERSLEVLPSDLRETVFVNACNVVLADGFAEKEEREFLAKLQQQLKIEPSTAQTIVQVIVIKNMG